MQRKHTFICLFLAMAIGLSFTNPVERWIDIPSAIATLDEDDSEDIVNKKQIFTIDGRERNYFLHLPANRTENTPLVFVLHGYGGTAKGTIRFSGMNAVADKHGFAVCYPEGSLGKDNKNSWNAGYSNVEVDDVKFLSNLAQYLHKTYNLNANSTFCTGLSNGADMSYVLACQEPDVFSAIAPVAGCMMRKTFETCNPSQPVPIFSIHGTEDPITLFKGDPDYLPGSGGYLGVEETLSFWAGNNGSAKALSDTLADKNTEDGSVVVWDKYAGTSKETEIWLYALVGGKHDWPGAWGNKDIVASEEIWRFFSQFVREPSDNRSKLVFFGSSVCKGAGADGQKGYAHQFFKHGAIDTLRYRYVNASTSGDNTLKIEQENRLEYKLYPNKPNTVVIGLSLNNEGIQRPLNDGGRQVVLEQFRTRLLALADSLQSQGIHPVIANCYAHSNFQGPHYAYTKKMNRIINTWKYPSINLLGTIDDGIGRWVDGYAADPGHPNALGHREMSLAIVPSLFDALEQGKKTPAYDWSPSYIAIDNKKKKEVFTYEVPDSIHSFTMSFRFKNANNGIIARIGTDRGDRDVKLNGFSLQYMDKKFPYPRHTGEWNHLVISHNYANQRTSLAINGTVIAMVKEQLVPGRFVFGGTIEKADLKDLMLHRSSLHEDEITDLNNKFLIQSSLEIYSPLTTDLKGKRLPNVAQSLSELTVDKGVTYKWVEKSFY